MSVKNMKICKTPTLEKKRLSVAEAGFRANLDGTISGYASLFGLPDLSRDVVSKGAFLKTLKERGAKNIRMLLQHDPDRPIGIWTAIKEDEKGLLVRGRINTDTELGRETLALVRQGALDGLSIGFKTQKAKRNATNQTRNLMEIDLWEISIVTFPMLPQACIETVKSQNSGAQNSRRQLEHWLMRDAGLSRRAAQTLLSKGFGALEWERERDAAATKNMLADKIRTATKLLQIR